MKVRVDPLKCQGYGYCVELASEVFSFDDWGYVQSRDIVIDESNSELFERVISAIDKCPVKAIREVRDDVDNEILKKRDWSDALIKLSEDRESYS